AFHLADKKFFPSPGTMVRDLIAVLGAGELSQRLPHVYFAVPRAWGLALPLDEGPPAITVTQVVPGSEREDQHWKQHGPRAFEAALDAADVGDLRRTSVI